MVSFGTEKGTYGRPVLGLSPVTPPHMLEVLASALLCFHKASRMSGAVSLVIHEGLEGREEKSRYDTSAKDLALVYLVQNK